MPTMEQQRALNLDLTNKCRKPRLDCKVVDVEEVSPLPYSGLPPSQPTELRRTSRRSIPTDFYRDRNDQEDVFLAQAIQLSRRENRAVEFAGGGRRSSRQSIPNDFYHSTAMKKKNSFRKKGRSFRRLPLHRNNKARDKVEDRKNATHAVTREQGQRAVVLLPQSGANDVNVGPAGNEVDLTASEQPQAETQTGRRSSRRSVPTDFYIAGLDDLIKSSENKIGKPKKETIPKKKAPANFKRLRQKPITVEEAVMESPDVNKEASAKQTPLAKNADEDASNEPVGAASPQQTPNHVESPAILLTSPSPHRTPSSCAKKKRRLRVIPASLRKKPPRPSETRSLELYSPKDDGSVLEKQSKDQWSKAVPIDEREKNLPAKGKVSRKIAMNYKDGKIDSLLGADMTDINHTTRRAKAHVQPKAKRLKALSGMDALSETAQGSLREKESKGYAKKRNGFVNKIGKLVRTVPGGTKRKCKRKATEKHVPMPRPKMRKVESPSQDFIEFGEGDFAAAGTDDALVFNTAGDGHDDIDSVHQVMQSAEPSSVTESRRSQSENETKRRGRPPKSAAAGGASPAKADGESLGKRSLGQMFSLESEAAKAFPVDFGNNDQSVQPKKRRGRPPKQSVSKSGSGFEDSAPTTNSEMSTQKAIQMTESSEKNKDAQSAKIPKRRGRPPKQAALRDESIVEQVDEHVGQKKRRGRPRKISLSHDISIVEETVGEKKSRGRPPKQSTSRDDSILDHDESVSKSPKRRGRPPKKAVSQDGPIFEEGVSQPKRRGRPPKQAISTVNFVAEFVENTTEQKRRGQHVKESSMQDSPDGEGDETERQPKRRGRPPKQSMSNHDENVKQPKRRGRPPKQASKKDSASDGDKGARQPRRRGRPPNKSSKEDFANRKGDESAKQTKRRGRPPKPKDSTAPPKQAKRRGRRPLRVLKDCGTCLVCRRAVNCGRCESCVNMIEFGGDGSLGAKCVLRVCITPIVLEEATGLVISKGAGENNALGLDSTLESAIEFGQAESHNQASAWYDSGVESLSDNASMAVDEMSDLEWEDGYERGPVHVDVSGVLRMSSFVAPVVKRVSSPAMQNTRQVGVDDKGSASHDKVAGTAICVAQLAGATAQMSKDAQTSLPRKDAAEMARDLLRHERMQYLNDNDDDDSFEISEDEDDFAPPPPPLDFGE